MTRPAIRDEAAAHRFAKDHLKAFVERVERLEEEKKALSDDIHDIYAEAKANGFDVKALRAVVRLRKQDVDERREQEAILETYLQALGMLDYTPEPRTGGGAGVATNARAQACDFASDAVIRTTIPQPAEGNDPRKGDAGGPQRPLMEAPERGEPEAGLCETVGASALRTAALLAPAAPDADEGACGDGREPCPATNSSSARPLRGPLPSGEGEPAVTLASGRAETDPSSPPLGGEWPRPVSDTIPDPGGADDLELPRELRIGDPENAWLRPQPTAPPSTGPP